MREILRDDGELCGFVQERGEQWNACTVFGVTFATHADEQSAARDVLHRGLQLLADRWELRARCEDEWHTVCIQEANPRRVRLALGYYSLPEVPTRTISVDELRAGEFELRPRS